MPDIPTRLLVISARVPEGERCEGCQFLHQSKTYEYECSLFGWDYVTREWPNSQEDPLGEPDLYRLPACRERDGWRCYPPDSGVAELVEAAKEYAATDRRSREHQEALGDLRGAARKVAGEAGYE